MNWKKQITESYNNILDKNDIEKTIQYWEDFWIKEIEKIPNCDASRESDEYDKGQRDMKEKLIKLINK